MDNILKDFEIKNSLINELDRIIDYKRGLIDKRKEKEGKKKFSFLENFSFGSNEKYISVATEIRNELFNIELVDNNIVKIDDELTNLLDSVCSCFDNPKDIDLLVNMINEPIKNSNNVYKDNMDSIHKKINALSSKIDLGKTDIGFYDEFGRFKRNLGSFDSNINDLFKKMTDKQLSSKYTFTADAEVNKNNQDIFITQLEDMVKKGKIGKNDINDFNLFKTHYINIIKQDKFIMIYDSCINKMGDYNNIYSNVINFLEKKKIESINQRDNSQKIINKYDLLKLESLISKFNKENDQEELHKIGYNQYKNLSHQLLIAKENNDFKLVNEIEEKMAKCAFDYKLDNSMLFNASVQSQEEYRNEKASNKAVSDGIKGQNDQLKMINAHLYSFLRERAIKELEDKKMFDNISSVVNNGDISVSAELQERENLIKDKMDDIVLFCEMSPEQRGLKMLKDNGRLPKDATIDNLTQQQKMDFRYAYRDSAYDFVSDYKSFLQGEKKKSVYAEYIVYKANLEDKSKAISLGEFISLKYNDENMQINETVGKNR